MTNEELVVIKDLSYEIEEKDIVKNVSFKLDNNQIIVITGPNGGGKTTIGQLIMGIKQPTSGQILFQSEDITDYSIAEHAKLGISYGFQKPVLFKGLTVSDLLVLANPDVTKQEAIQGLENVGLDAKLYLDRELNNSLSGGELKRIEIATALLRHDKLTILDEPEAGIDLWSFQKLIYAINNIKNTHGGTFIIISHQEKILSQADKIMVVQDGEIIEFAAKEEVYPKLFCSDEKCGLFNSCLKKGGKS